MSLRESFTRGMTPKEIEMLGRYSAPPWVFWTLGFFIALLLVVEVPLIMVVLSMEFVIRVQTLNGGLMMGGALVAFCLSIFVIMYPVKRLTIRMAVLQEEMIQEMRKRENPLGLHPSGQTKEELLRDSTRDAL